MSLDLNIAVLPFAITAAVLIVLPGPDTTVVLRSIVRDGRPGAVRTAFGVCCGLAVWMVVATVGLTALLTASRVAYDVLKIVGAVYLCWLGVRTLFGSLRRRARPTPLTDAAAGEASGLPASTATDSITDAQTGTALIDPARVDPTLVNPALANPALVPEDGASALGAHAPAAPRARPRGRGFWIGFTTDVLNPKVGVLFVTLLPQFVGQGEHVTAAVLLLGAAYIAGTAGWFAVLVRLAGSIAGWLRRARTQRWISRITGVALIGFAVDLLADTR